MGQVVAALAGLLVVTLLPGALLVVAVTRSGSRARYAALGGAPAVTTGLAGFWFGWAGGLGLRWSAPELLVAELVTVGVLALALAVARHSGWGTRLIGPRMHRTVHRRPHVWWHEHRTDVVALFCATSLAAAAGVRLLGGLRYPPGFDAMNHAFMARRVLDLGSVLPADICVDGSTAVHTSCTFYPLVPHVLWAQAVWLTGAPLSSVMLMTEMVLVPAVAAVSAYTLVRLLGAGPWAAGAMAAGVGAIGPLGLSYISGLITMSLGAALSPGVALLVYVGMHFRRARAVRMVGGLAVGGLLLSHTYDVVIAVVMGIGLLTTEVLTRERFRRLGWTLLLTLAGAALVVGPLLGEVFGAGAVRHPSPPRFPGDLSGAASVWLFTVNRYLLGGLELTTWSASTRLTIALGSIVGLGMVAAVVGCWQRSRRYLRPFVVTQVVVIGLMLLVDSGTGPIRGAVASIFYGQARRVFFSSMVAPSVLTVGGWLVVGSAVASLFRFVRGRRTGVRGVPERRPVLLGRPGWRNGVAGTAPLFLSAFLVVVVLASPLTGLAVGELGRRSPTDSRAYERVGAWLAARVSAREVVAEDFHRDFVPWPAADDGIGLLDGVFPLVESSQEDWRARQRLWRQLSATAPGRAEQPCLPDPYGVVFVVVSAEAMPDGVRHYTRAGLDGSPYLSVAHRDGPLTVYAVHGTCRDTVADPTG